MRSSLLSLTALIPTLALGAPLEARAITKAIIKSVSAIGTGCPTPGSTVRSISSDGWTAAIGYTEFASNEIGNNEACTLSLNYEVVIPSDGKADLELQVWSIAYYNAGPETQPRLTATLTQNLAFGGKANSTRTTLSPEASGRADTRIKLSVSGAAGSTVSGSATATIEGLITGGSSGPSVADLQVESSHFNFLPLPPAEGGN
ncbi:hypothetical protein B0J11DRAFT_520025 [Dendryphion nanum]|uniref:Uncharacterized protein n=1 Tax=Dendryphion nanum TaxID=256645 RepID=A0A9P9EES8_9PLEO|nr:hypothetical protein B0J11DRAFT_520025 [Dendryphion nanum]